MKTSTAIVTLFLSLTALPAAPSAVFFKALHHVETSGRFGPIRGDHGKALGPMQIHEIYFRDSGVPGKYSQCGDYAFSVRVVTAYLQKHAAEAWRRGDMVSLARTHNGGPRGAVSAKTLRYADKFKRAFNDISKR